MSTPNAAASRPWLRQLRRLRRSLWMVLLLLLVLHLAGGWYFSGQIRSDGLAVRPYPVENNLILAPRPDGTVRIESTDASETRMLRAPSTYGVKWKGGYGRVSGPVVSQERSAVVRRFEVVTGSEPDAGTRASIDLVAYPDDPQLALGPEVDEVTYTSPLGSFPAYFVPGPRGDQKTWAILVHGKGGSRMEMYRMARATVAAGLPSLDITYRNDDGTPRDPSGYYQYGRTEWQDLEGAVTYAADHGADRVVLGADSMGGGIVASYLRHRRGDDVGPEVVATILDAPMLDFGETVSFGARQLELPAGAHVPPTLTWTAKRIAAQRFDLDWDTVDYLAEGAPWLKVSTLVFHGTADTTVPISTSRELKQQNPGLVTLVETRGVEHVRSWNADPRAYDRAVQELVDRL